MIKQFIVNFVTIFSDVFLILLFTRVVLTFVPTSIGRFRLFVYNATEPLLAPIRKAIPPLGGSIDLSPIILYLIFQIVIEIVTRYL